MADFEVQRDLVQEVFMRAFSEKARLSYDGIRSFKAFLVSITRNVIIDYLRKKPTDALSHISLSLDDEDLSDDQKAYSVHLNDTLASNEDDIDWQRAVSATRSFLQTFEGRKGDFIQLRFHQELPLVEVAKRMNITRGKARFWEQDLARRVRRHLRSKLSQCSSKNGQIKR